MTRATGGGRRVALTDIQLFAGQQEAIAMMELRRHPGDVIAQVQMGKVFIITKSGKPVAVISKPEPSALALGAALRAIERRHAAPAKEGD